MYSQVLNINGVLISGRVRIFLNFQLVGGLISGGVRKLIQIIQDGPKTEFSAADL